MREGTTRMTRKGQITVPVEIRNALNLQVGDTVVISLREGDGTEATLRSVRSVIDATFGALATDKQFDDKTLRGRFMESAQERDQRTQR